MPVRIFASFPYCVPVFCIDRDIFYLSVYLPIWSFPGLRCIFSHLSAPSFFRRIFQFLSDICPFAVFPAPHTSSHVSSSGVGIFSVGAPHCRFLCGLPWYWVLLCCQFVGFRAVLSVSSLASYLSACVSTPYYHVPFTCFFSVSVASSQCCSLVSARCPPFGACGDNLPWYLAFSSFQYYFAYSSFLSCYLLYTLRHDFVNH